MKTFKLLRSVCLPSIVLAMGLLSACGQKGPLSLPKDAAKPVAAATAASAPASAPVKP